MAKVSNIVRFTLLGVTTFYFVVKTFPKTFLPHGPAVALPDRKSFAHVDQSNDSLQLKHGRTKRIYERLEEGQKKPLMVGPETIVFGNDGTLYTLSEEGKLISMTDFQEQEDGVSIMATSTLVKDLGVGRPLGGKFSMDGQTIYIADATLGLTRVENPTDPKSKVELVASTYVDKQGKRQQLLYTNDLCIGPKTGKVYFTDASNVAPDRIGTRTFDTMYAAKVDLIRGVKSGRLLEYDPNTDEVTLLADSLHFANGVAVDKDETYLFLAETWAPRLWKYHLEGDKKGTLEVAVENKNLAGYPDGTECSWSSNKGKCYAALPSSIIPFHHLMAKLPDAMDLVWRTIYLLLPRSMAPRINMYGGVIETDPETKEFRYIQDPTGTDIVVITGVTEYNGKLYLGSLTNNYITVYDLADDDTTTKPTVVAEES